MRVHLGGHLSWYEGEKRDWVELQQEVPISLAELAALLRVPRADIALISVNRRLANWDDAVTDRDIVEFFPPMSGG